MLSMSSSVNDDPGMFAGVKQINQFLDIGTYINIGFPSGGTMISLDACLF